MEIQILPAKPEQADILTQIALAAKRHWGYPERWMDIWKPELTFRPEYFQENESWVAQSADTAIAFYTLREQQGSAWLENLWVVPQFMGNGVGKQLFLHAVERTQQRGYTDLRLEADPNAIGFYEKLGMHKAGERQSQIDGQPRLLPIMAMKLYS